MLTSQINASSIGLLLVIAAVAASPARRRYISCVAVLIASLGGVPAAFSQGAFQGLGDLPGGRGSHANAVSADGSVVVGFGYDSSAAQHAIRWTQADGMQIMFPGGFGFDFTSNAFGISADGLTIGGWHAATIIEIQAFIWSAATGEQQLATRSAVLALSATGAVGAGYVVHGRGQAPRATIWDIDRHEIFIDSPGVIPNSDARGISADGMVVVGHRIFVALSACMIKIGQFEILRFHRLRLSNNDQRIIWNQFCSFHPW